MKRACLKVFMVLALLMPLVAVSLVSAQAELANQYVVPHTPTAGTIWYGGEIRTFHWKNGLHTSTVATYISTDNGATYEEIDGGLTADKDQEQVSCLVVPSVNSTQCIMKYHYTWEFKGVQGDGDVYSEVFQIAARRSPLNLSAEALSPTSIQLNWDVNGLPDEGYYTNVEYQIDRRIPGTTYWEAIQEGLPVETASFLDGDCLAATTYEYRLTGYYNGEPYTNPTNTAVAATPAMAGPPNINVAISAPTGLIAEANANKTIGLHWTDTAADETGYRIMRQQGDSGTMALLLTLPADTETYSDASVSPGVTYYYQVVAANATDESAPSNVASATVAEQEGQAASKVLRFQIGQTTFYVNDEAKTLDAAPISSEGRILLPIRFVVENLGGSAEWDGSKATINCNGHVLILGLNQNSAQVDGQNVFIDPANPAVMPLATGGRIMMPLRFVGESVGCSADWTGTEAVISYPATQ